MFIFGGFGWLDATLTSYITNPVLHTLIFFGIIFLVNDVLHIPFELYDTFVIEQNFGFNKVTPKIFILDKIKSYLLTIVIGGGLLFAIVSFYNYTPEYFWIISWTLVTAFSLFMSCFIRN